MSPFCLPCVLLLCCLPVTHGATFDFSETGLTSGNNSRGNGSGNVNRADATLAATTVTVDGITVTVTVTASSSGTATIGANNQGFGVSTNGESSSNDTRIESDKGESLRFSFDTAVALDSLRLGNFAGAESLVLTFISGTNPFAPATSYTLTSTGLGPADDIPLPGIATVAAGTVLSLQITGGAQDGL